MKGETIGDRMPRPIITEGAFPFRLLTALLLLCLAISCCLGGKTTTIVRHTDTLDPQADGFWANKTTWNARWVKYWRTKKIYEPVWKKVWTPTVHNEWVPLPNAPTEWEHEEGHAHAH
ncbi:GL17737 [Drosophila persimilis]|uniref:GL17737 n=1 Tax=Drosophila persimilis TaxID=7234 RepID=B4GIL5_DROPE|nr:GL17737 [Drosophila persimilis]